VLKQCEKELKAIIKKHFAISEGKKKPKDKTKLAVPVVRLLSQSTLQEARLTVKALVK
jgi:hypothetical protein